MLSLRLLGVYGVCLGFGCLPLAVHAQMLPPPPPPAAGGITVQTDMSLHLQLAVNQRLTGRVVRVTRKAGRYFVELADLEDLRLPEWARQDVIDLTGLEGVQVGYDAPRQRLDLTVPSSWLPYQYLEKSSSDPVTALSSPGALVNYNFYTSKAREGATRFSLWHEARVFGMGGLWRTSGIFRENADQRFDWSADRGYLRYDTTWRYADQHNLLVYEAGDVITRPLSWTRAVRLGGIQVSRDFSMRPDLITYPLPSFEGSAAVPSTLDLFVNGSRVGRHDIDPGPFTLTDIPNISGAGEATVITEDVQGRRVVTTVPFYVTNELLRPGLSSFSASLGALRRHYGQRSFDYGEMAASVSNRIGVNEWLTLAGHVEVSDSVNVAGVGSTFGVWRAGTLELAYQYSNSELGRGNSYSLGYQYRGGDFSLGGRYERRSEGFFTLSDVGLRQPAKQARTSLQVTAGASLGRWGSVGAGYFDIDTHAAPRTRVWNLSYHRPLSDNTHFSLSTNREIGGGWAGLLQVTIALGNGRGVVSAGAERDANGRVAQRLQYSRSAPLEGGWGWNMGVRRSDGQSLYRQADLVKRGQSATWRTGLYGSGNNDVYFGEVSGAAVLMAGRGFLTNEVDDSFVVVSTDGEPNVPIRYENQKVGETDADGYLLVPWGTAYYPGKYEMDPLALPAGITTTEVDRRVAVESQSGYLLRFSLPHNTSASLQLVDAQGEVLPVGVRVLTAEGVRAVVGWDGMTYLEKINEGVWLDAELPEGGRCRAELRIPKGAKGLLNLGVATCR